jgi:hypothetical protein
MGFGVYFPIGFDHIVSLAGFDHLLFIIVLCARFEAREWRRILLLLTGFTLGHSLTLALTALQVASFPQRWVELLIPVTILMTSLGNVLRPKPVGIARPLLMASVFGLVHGCGFAGYFGMMLGDEQSVVMPLLAFNMGLEAGQIVVVAAFYFFWFVLEKMRPIPQRDLTFFVSGAGAGLAIKLILEQL